MFSSGSDHNKSHIPPSCGNSMNRSAVEHLHAVPPHVDRPVFPKTIIVKTIHLTDLATLMIAAEKSYAVWVADLEAEKQQTRLHAVIATIHIVAHK